MTRASISLKIVHEALDLLWRTVVLFRLVFLCSDLLFIVGEASPIHAKFLQ
jgi:hypothetical protein